MAVKPYSENSHKHSEKLIYDLQAPNRRRREPPNKRSRLILQTVSLREPDSRECDNEQSHQPVLGECAAEHIDDAFLAWLGEEGKRLKDTIARKERKSGGKTGYQSRNHNHERSAQSKGQPDDHDRNSTELQQICEMHFSSRVR